MMEECESGVRPRCRWVRVGQGRSRRGQGGVGKVRRES